MLMFIVVFALVAGVIGWFVSTRGPSGGMGYGGRGATHGHGFGGGSAGAAWWTGDRPRTQGYDQAGRGGYQPGPYGGYPDDEYATPVITPVTPPAATRTTPSDARTTPSDARSEAGHRIE